MSIDNVQSNTPEKPVALDLDEAAEAILKNWEDAEEPSEGNLEANDKSVETDDESSNENTESEVEVEENDDLQEEDPETEESDESEVEDETSEEQEEEPVEEEVAILEDDAVVQVKVDGKTEEVSVKSLKRLHGQESSLTKKSQEVSNQRKEAEEALNEANFVMQNMLKRAEERFKPYSEVDYLLASKTMEADDFALLRQEATQAESDLKFLRQEADTLYNKFKEKNVAQQRENAKNCIEVLERDIPDWSPDLYDQIRKFSIDFGLPEEQVNNYADPVVIKLLHQSMLYSKMKEKAGVVKKKAVKSKVLRSKKSPPKPVSNNEARKKAAYQKLAKSGGSDLDDISAAILAGWES